MANITGLMNHLRHALVAILTIAASLASASAWAGRMDPGDFTAAAIVDDLNDVATTQSVINHSIARDGFQLHSNVASFVYDCCGVDGNGFLMPNSPAGIGVIAFDTPWQKAGVSVFNVGVTQVVFFGSHGNYLGDVTWVAGPSWATIAWDNGSEGIGAIWVVEGEFGHYIGFDAITREHMITPVPEPETYAMLLAGLGMLGIAARRRRTSMAELR
jgi:hypothetical protein